MTHHDGAILLRILILFIAIPQWGYALDDSSIPSHKEGESQKINRRDPTEPSMGQSTGKIKETEANKLQLRSTLVGGTQRIALINDTFVHVGDTIGTAKVIAIHADSVVLIDSGRTLTLYLFENDIRK